MFSSAIYAQVVEVANACLKESLGNGVRVELNPITLCREGLSVIAHCMKTDAHAWDTYCCS